MARVDGFEKVVGGARYAADVDLPELAHAAIVRSSVVSGRIRSIDTSWATKMAGVIGVFSAGDVSPNLSGLGCRDIPILARERVRFIGERVAVVVAESRDIAEAAAGLVEIDYDPMPAVFDPREALLSGAPAVHEAPWDYEGAFAVQGDPINLQMSAKVTAGSEIDVDRALKDSAYIVESSYVTPSGHQGYLEPHACVAVITPDNTAHVWLSTKSPYETRQEIARCLGRDPLSVVIEPIMVGGDFGGKGTPMDATLCLELAKLVRRPVKIVLRYSEELIATNPRHPAWISVRLGCDVEGRLTALKIDGVVNAGAYAGFKTRPNMLSAIVAVGCGYRIPLRHCEMRAAYTNTVPRGSMRAPGSPQGNFALESALDELAIVAGIEPVEFRMRNLLDSGEPNGMGTSWDELRVKQLLSAAIDARLDPIVPEGWVTGWGVGLEVRGTRSAPVSLRIGPSENHKVRLETSTSEAGAGNHTVIRSIVASELGFEPEDVEIVHVSTADLPTGAGLTGSRSTRVLANAAIQCARAWQQNGGRESVMVDLPAQEADSMSASCVEIAQVAVDPETGQVRVLEIITAIDPSRIVNPEAFRLQVDGGVAMGYGFACLEDLAEDKGQIWAANLGEFKIPSSRDVPKYLTIMLGGEPDIDPSVIKPIGELTTPPTAAAIANAVFAAVGCRIRALPITAEKVHGVLTEAPLVGGEIAFTERSALSPAR